MLKCEKELTKMARNKEKWYTCILLNDTEYHSVVHMCITFPDNLPIK